MPAPTVPVNARSSAVLSGSASTAVRHLLSGPPREGVVVAAARFAAYLRVGAEVLALLTSDADRVPCAVVLAPGVGLPGSLLPGTSCAVGEGTIRWPAPSGRTASVRVDRWWPPAAVTTGATDAPALALLERLAAASPLTVDELTATVVDDAARALSIGSPESAVRLLTSVLGRGPGLTPSGDDAAAGLLLTARALSTDAGRTAMTEQVAHAVAVAANGRTTAVSAGLLAHCANGFATTAVVEAVDALVGRVPAQGTDAAARFARLLDVGHSSGLDTAAGMLAAARHLSAPALDDHRTVPRSPRPHLEPA